MEASRVHHLSVKAISPQLLRKRLPATPPTSSSLQPCAPHRSAALIAPQCRPPSKARSPHPDCTQPTALGRPLRCPSSWGPCSAPPCCPKTKTCPATRILPSCCSPGWTWSPPAELESRSQRLGQPPALQPVCVVPPQDAQQGTHTHPASHTPSVHLQFGHHPELKLSHFQQQPQQQLPPPPLPPPLPRSSHPLSCLHPSTWLPVSRRALLGLPVPRMWTLCRTSLSWRRCRRTWSSSFRLSSPACS